MDTTEEQNKRKLKLIKIEMMKKSLSERKLRILAAKEEVVEKNDACLSALTGKKEEIVKIFDELIKNASNQITEANKCIEHDVAAVTENLKLLENAENSENLGNTDSLESVKNFSQQVSGPTAYKYVTYKPCVGDAETICGIIVTKETGEQQQQLDAVKTTTQMKCRVTGTIATEHSQISHVIALPGSRVAVSSTIQLITYNCHRLILYDLQTGRESSSMTLEENPSGMTQVTLADRACIAVSYSGQMKIEFHAVSNVKEIVLSYSVAPHRPGVMCGALRTRLLYEDRARTATRDVQWLDCCELRPRHVNVTHTEQESVTGMCFVQQGSTGVLLTTSGSGGVCAINISTEELIWRVEGKLPDLDKKIWARGVTDGCGHLLVTDNNNCSVERFSVDDGFVGTVVKKGEQGLGDPQWIASIRDTSSFVVTNFKDGAWSITTFELH